MGNTTFVLTLTIGEYDSRCVHMLAASRDKNKLEEFVDKDLAKRLANIKLFDDCQAEYDRLLALHPFPEPAPPSRLPKPEIAPKTKAEHEARKAAKDECEAKYAEWSNNKFGYEQSIWNNACGMVYVQNGITGNDYPTRYFSPNYYERDIKRTDYEIEEVEELV